MRQWNEHNKSKFRRETDAGTKLFLTAGIRGFKKGFNVSGIKSYSHVQWLDSVHSLQGHVTLREIEVLQMLSDGDSSKIIADKLHISETTAITHRKNLIKKLNVRNTAHLIKVAILSNIIV